MKTKGLFGVAIAGSYWVCNQLPPTTCKADTECNADESCLPRQINVLGFSLVSDFGDKYCLEDADECDFLNAGKGCAEKEVCRKKKPSSILAFASILECLGDNKNDNAACFECVALAEAKTTKAPAVTTSKPAEAARSCNAYSLGRGQTDACTCTDQEEKVKMKGRGGLFVFDFQTYWICKALPEQTCASSDECTGTTACLPRKVKKSLVFGISITVYSDEKYCVEDEDECDSLNRGRGCDKGQLCQKKPGAFGAVFKACEIAAIATGSDVGTCYECVTPTTDNLKTTTAAPDSTKTCNQYLKGLGQPESCLCPKGTRKALVKGRFGTFLSFSDSYFECKEVEAQGCTEDDDCTEGASCVKEKAGSSFLGGLFGGASKSICVDDEDECDALNNGNGCLLGQTCGRLGRFDYAVCIAKGFGDSSKCFECKGAVQTTTARPTDGSNDGGGNTGATNATSCNLYKYGVDKLANRQTDNCTCNEKEEKVKTKGFLGMSVVGAYWICRPLPESTCQVDADCTEDESCLPRQINALAGIWGDLTGKNVPKYCLEDVDECDFMNDGAGCDEGQICRKKTGKGLSSFFAGGMQAVTCILKRSDACFECVAAPSKPTSTLTPSVTSTWSMTPSKTSTMTPSVTPSKPPRPVSTPLRSTPTSAPLPWSARDDDRECDPNGDDCNGCETCTKTKDASSGAGGVRFICITTCVADSIGPDPILPPQPVIKVIGETTIDIEASETETYTDNGASCHDFANVDISSKVEVAGQAVNLAVPGTYVIKYLCTDKFDGNAVPQSRVVNVVKTPVSSTADGGAAKLAELNAAVLLAQTKLAQLKAEMAAAVASGATDSELDDVRKKVNEAEVIVASASSAAQTAADSNSGSDTSNTDPVVKSGGNGVVIGVLVALLILVLAVVAVLLVRNKNAQNPIAATAAAVNNNPTYDTDAHTVAQAGGVYTVPMERVPGVDNPMYASMA